MSGTEGCSWYGEDFCAICHLKFAEIPGNKVTLGNKALNTLAEYSVDVKMSSSSPIWTRAQLLLTCMLIAGRHTPNLAGSLEMRLHLSKGNSSQ